MMPVTSQLRPGQAFGEVRIALSRKTGLIKPSAITPAFPALEQRLVIRGPGTIEADDQAVLRKAIQALAGQYAVPLLAAWMCGTYVRLMRPIRWPGQPCNDDFKAIQSNRR